MIIPMHFAHYTLKVDGDFPDIEQRIVFTAGFGVTAKQRIKDYARTQYRECCKPDATDEEIDARLTVHKFGFFTSAVIEINEVEQFDSLVGENGTKTTDFP